jgi:hypothetical protein
VTNPPADVTKDFTDSLGETLGGVSPPLGQTVTRTGDTLHGVVGGLGTSK